MDCSRCLKSWGCFLVALLAVSVSGCSGSASNTHKVSGKVTTADGTPVKGVAVGFTGTGSKAFGTGGTTGEDGVYTLSTFEENDGAPPGDYVVSITDGAGNALKIEGKDTVTVAAGSNTFDFKVDSAGVAAPANP